MYWNWKKLLKRATVGLIKMLIVTILASMLILGTSIRNPSFITKAYLLLLIATTLYTSLSFFLGGIAGNFKPPLPPKIITFFDGTLPILLLSVTVLVPLIY